MTGRMEGGTPGTGDSYPKGSCLGPAESNTCSIPCGHGAGMQGS